MANLVAKIRWLLKHNFYARKSLKIHPIFYIKPILQLDSPKRYLIYK